MKMSYFLHSDSFVFPSVTVIQYLGDWGNILHKASEMMF